MVFDSGIRISTTLMLLRKWASFDGATSAVGQVNAFLIASKKHLPAPTKHAFRMCMMPYFHHCG